MMIRRFCSASKKFKSEMVLAMKSKDSFRVGVIRSLISKLDYDEKQKARALEAGDVTAVVRAMIEESAGAQAELQSASAGGDAQAQSALEKSERSIAILREFLPEQLSDDALLALAQRRGAELGVQGVRDTGKLVAALKDETQGAASPKSIGEVVRKVIQEI